MRAFVLKCIRRLLKRSAKVATVDGFWVGSDDLAHRDKVLEALRLIEAVDRRRYLRLKTDLTGIWVTLLTSAYAQFYYLEFFCDVDERYVARSTIAEIASTLVHEATHARLWRRFGYDEGIRERIERICVAQQAAFCARLPGQADEKPALLNLDTLPPDFWSHEAFARRHHRGSVAVFRHLNLPSGLILFMLRRRRAAVVKRRRQQSGVR